jgi:hypothetical protein
MKWILLVLLLVLGTSCSEEEVYTQKELWYMAIEVDPDIELVGIASHEEHRRILCKNYGPGCVKGTGRRIKVKKVEIIAIMFETKEQARAEALRIDQYYARNWVFDDIKGEPLQEAFVKKAFKAIDAKAEYMTAKEKE